MRARAGRHRPTARSSLPVQSDSSSRRAAASRRALALTCASTCVRACATPAHRQSVASAPSQVSHVYLSVCRRARECLPPACASVVCVIVSAARSLPSHPLEFPRLVRTSAPASSPRSILVVVVVSSPEEKTSADVDVNNSRLSSNSSCSVDMTSREKNRQRFLFKSVLLVISFCTKTNC